MGPGRLGKSQRCITLHMKKVWRFSPALIRISAGKWRNLWPNLDALIRKALEKNREQRYQHASEIRSDLEQLKRQNESGGVAASASKPRYYTTGGSDPQVKRVRLLDGSGETLGNLKDFHFASYTQIHDADTALSAAPDGPPLFLLAIPVRKRFTPFR
jgi:hypothetical protein